MARKPKSIFYVGALLIILLAGVSNYVWTKSNNSIVGIDSQNHLLFSIEFFYSFSDIVQSPLSLFEKLKGIIDLLGEPVMYSGVYWPNGLNLNASLFYFLFGKSLLAAKSTLLIYLFILLFSTYKIGRLIWNDSVGFLALCILFMYPLIFESSRQFQLDFPLAAMVALNILLLLKCDYFRNRKYSFLFGLSLGWALLIKGQALLFIICPLFLVLYKSFNKETLKNFFKSSQLKNMVTFMFTAGLIASIWWAHQLPDTISSLSSHIFDATKSLESHWSWDKKYSFPAISFHSREFFSSLSLPFYIAFLISFLFFLKQKVRFKGILLSWLIPSFLLFSLVFSIKHARFLMPILPAMALITAQGLYRIRSKRIQLSISSILIIFAIVQFHIFSYRILNCMHEEISLGKFTVLRRTKYATFPSDKEYLEVSKLVQIIRRYKSSEKSIKIGLILTCDSRFRMHEAVYWLKMNDNSFDPIELTEMHENFYENLDSFDFILFSVPPQTSLPWPAGEEFITLLKRYNYPKIHFIETETDGFFTVVWEELLKKIEDAKPYFRLVDKLSFDTRGICYVYIRRDTSY